MDIFGYVWQFKGLRVMVKDGNPHTATVTNVDGPTVPMSEALNGLRKATMKVQPDVWAESDYVVGTMACNVKGKVVVIAFDASDQVWGPDHSFAASVFLADKPPIKQGTPAWFKWSQTISKRIVEDFGKHSPTS